MAASLSLRGHQAPAQPQRDRQFNRALHTIVVARLRDDSQIRAYAARRRAEGKSARDIRRCLKRWSPASCSSCWNAATVRPWN
jgi:hypothetical protein